MLKPTQPTLPPITLTRLDYESLTALLDEDREGIRQLLVDRLDEELRRAKVVENAVRGVVTLGSRVEYENVESGERHTVELVLPSRAAAGSSKLSVLTPIGCSLIGLHEGDTFTWDAGMHRWRLRVVSVRPPDPA